MASLMETRRQIMLNTPHLETLTDSLVSFDTDVPADLKGHKLYIEPIQDLHGYDYPWPEGGGKNLLPKGVSSTSSDITFTVQDDGSVKMSGTSVATAFWGVKFTIPPGTYTYSGDVENSFGLTLSIRDAVGGTGIPGINARTFTISESLTAYYNIRVPSGVTVSNLIFYPQLEFGSIATPFAPYSNICPISGRTGVKVVRRGKNLLKNTLKTVTYNGVNFTVNNDGTMLLSGTAIGTAQKTINSNLSLYAGTYILTGMASGGSSSTRMIYISDGSKIIARNDGKGATFTLSEEKIISVLCWVANGVEVNDLQINPMIRKADVIDDVFEPYQDESYDITFPSEAGTVYGGTLDVKSGELTVDRAIVDLGTLTWSRGVTYVNVFYSSDLRNCATGVLNRIQCISSAYKAIGSCGFDVLSANDKSVTIQRNYRTVGISDSSYSDAVSFKSAMSGVQLAYELATPITYQLTPHTLKALRGVNNIWSDASVNTQVRFWTHKKED